MTLTQTLRKNRVYQIDIHAEIQGFETKIYYTMSEFIWGAPDIVATRKSLDNINQFMKHQFLWATKPISRETQVYKNFIKRVNKRIQKGNVRGVTQYER